MSLSPYILGIVTLCGIMPAWSQVLPFDELLIRAEQTNQDVAAVRQRVDEANGLLRQAGVRPAPTFNASGTTGRVLGTVGEEQFSAGFSKTLETGDKRSKRIEIAEAQVAAAKAEYEERIRQLRFELRLRYADFAGESSRVAVLSQLIDSLQQSLDLTRARAERGDAAPLDANLIAVELSRTQAQLASARGRLGVAQTELTRVAGLVAGTEPVIDPSFVPPRTRPDRGALVSRALLERPDLRTLQFQQQQGEAEQRLAEADGHANITVSAAYGYVKSRMDDQFGVNSRGVPVQIRDRDDVLSVGVSIPLFSKNRNQGNIEVSVAKTRTASLRKESLERSIPREIEAAIRRLEAAQNVREILGGSAKTQGEANLEVIRQAYQLGQMRLLDVLNEQRRLLDTKLAHADATTETLRSWAELERTVGGKLQ
ncbi:MAG: TolC family protein [Bryobacteraceae bacterium]